MSHLATTEIFVLLERERVAWRTGNIALLVDILHPDLLHVNNHKADRDVSHWRLPVGKFTTLLFDDKHRAAFTAVRLVRESSTLRRIEIAPAEDAALVVVDVEWVWKEQQTSREFQVNSRLVKLFSRTDDWKLTVQYGTENLFPFLTEVSFREGPVSPDEKECMTQLSEVVASERTSWTGKDIQRLLSIYHKDAVWPFLLDAFNPDPMGWKFVLGKFDHNRWSTYFQHLLNSSTLIRNIRRIRNTAFSPQRDSAIVTVDISTEWERRRGKRIHWKGRVAKIFCITPEGWKILTQVGPIQGQWLSPEFSLL